MFIEGLNEWLLTLVHAVLHTGGEIRLTDIILASRSLPTDPHHSEPNYSEIFSADNSQPYKPYAGHSSKCPVHINVSSPQISYTR